MRRTGSIRTGLAVALVSFAAAWGQTQPQIDPPVPVDKPADEPGSDLPSAESLFEKHVEAMGGREALEKITSREITGRIRSDDQNFLARLHMWSAAPNKMRTDVDAPGMGKTSTVFDGDVGWRVANDTHQLIVGDQLVDLALTADFYGEASYEGRYKRIETLDKAVFNDRQVYRVKCQAHSGKLSVVLFDAETGFVIGAQTTMHTAKGRVQVVLVLLDYEDIGGMMWPKNIIQVTPEGETRISYRKFVVNEVDESVFERPEEVDALVTEFEKLPKKPGAAPRPKSDP